MKGLGKVLLAAIYFIISETGLQEDLVPSDHLGLTRTAALLGGPFSLEDVYIAEKCLEPMEH